VLPFVASGAAYKARTGLDASRVRWAQQSGDCRMKAACVLETVKKHLHSIFQNRGPQPQPIDHPDAITTPAVLISVRLSPSSG